MGSDQNRISKLASAVADGSPIDWDDEESKAVNTEERRVVRRLRAIAMLAGEHWHEDDQPTPPLAAAGKPAAGKPDAYSTGGPTSHTASAGLGQWGGFLLIEEVGRGSFGTVYRAHDPTLDRPIAVKLLHRHCELIEGQMLARVVHPNVVTVYGAAEHDGRVGLWMEFVRGRTLEHMLFVHGPFSAAEAGLIGYELCGALAAVHRVGLVHRDVKAQNVMREEGGRLVLMDFGAGQRLSSGSAGRVVGTPLYVAPEVLSGAEATKASDVYSLGVMLYHLVSSDFPVKGADFDALTAAHARGEVTPLQDVRTDLPRAFVRVVEQAIDPRPEKRFSSAGRMATALGRIRGFGERGPAAPRLWSSRTSRTRSGRGASDRDASVPSIAVLPFIDMSPAKDQECFCDGITEEIINALTRVSGLRVAARNSAFQFKGQARDIRQIGEALNVASVLDGSVQKQGDQLRVRVELIGAADGYVRSSERFDRQVADIFGVQDEIASSVVTMLKGKLAAKEIVPVAPPGRDLDAYTSYLEGRYHWNMRTEDELKKSVACFEQAIERDPAYAQAYAGMADAYVTLGTYGALPAAEVMPRAKQVVERALEIDTTSAEAYTCRGCIRSVYDWAWSNAEHDFRHAIETQPSYPTAHHWYAINHLVPIGRFDEATAALRRALELDPLALAVKTSLGMKSYFAGQYDDAVRELTKTLELDDRFGMAHLFLGATYTEQAKYAQAREELEAATRLSGRRPEILAALGYLLGVSRDIAGARGVLEELRRLSHDRYVSPAKIAEVHVGLGEPQEALEQLEAAHAERAADLAWLNVRPVFASLRAAPRLVALVSQISLAA